MTVGAGSAARSSTQVFERRAVKDGRTVVALQGNETGAGLTVQVEIFPVTGLGLSSIPLGPFAFASSDDAVRFVEQALLALEYLGCSVEGGPEHGLRPVPDPA